MNYRNSMKIINLHDGDWIEKYDSEKECWIPIKVTLEFFKDNIDILELDLSCIRGIEVTPEFLKYNWYSKENTCGIDEWISTDRRITLRNDSRLINSNNKWSVHIDNVDMESVCDAELTCIHQFQHILDHCGEISKLRYESN